MGPLRKSKLIFQENYFLLSAASCAFRTYIEARTLERGEGKGIWMQLYLIDRLSFVSLLKSFTPIPTLGSATITQLVFSCVVQLSIFLLFRVEKVARNQDFISFFGW